MFALISSSILLTFYFIIFLIALIIFTIAGFDSLVAINFAVIFTFIFSIIQFFLSPFILDLSLKWMYNLKWVEYSELPTYLKEFVEKEFNKRNTKLPRIGIIEDFTPEAFTYGNFPNNARIVISRGLLQILNEDEVKAVVGHEIGHIFHWDFVFMTLASFIPFLLYMLYRIAYNLARSSRGNSRNNAAGQLLLVALITYLIYIVSEYIVLYLSRLREYYADKFSALTTLKPMALATALIKVAYGIIDPNYKTDTNQSQENTSIRNTPFKVLGLMDNKQAKSLRLSLLNSTSNLNSTTNVAVLNNTIEITTDEISTNYDVISKTLAWDLFNPWATLIELHSTHPLVAKRIKNLKEIAQQNNLPFNINIPTSLPKDKDDNSVDILSNTLIDEFIIDIAFQYAPLLGLLSGLFIGFIMTSTNQNGFNLIGFPILLLALGSLAKWIYSYKIFNPNFKEYKIIDLLSKTKVSIIRSIPAILKGKIMGRGVAGYIFSEDITFKDETGFIYVDYRIGFQLAEMAYGFFVTNNLIGKNATIKGYYRRSYAPYFEVIEIITEDNKVYKSYFRFFWLFLIIILLLIGGFLTFLGLMPIQ
ncbi:MAG: zinc metalloprotease HtpX [bacterium]|nr:zinc metalloprotease HtpX [bacterium]